MSKGPQEFTIYAISDATSDLSVNIAMAAVKQFNRKNVKIKRKRHITTPEGVRNFILEVSDEHAAIVFTFVSADLRKLVIELAERAGVPAFDVMGPLMDCLAQSFHMAPSDQPGQKYRLTEDFFRRNRAIEYTVHHDDGLGLEDLDEADIILMGISRSSKTPLSVFLAFRGFKVANIPVVLDVPAPKELEQAQKEKIVGLIVSPELLSNRREARLNNLGRPLTEDYAQIEHINKEIDYAQKVFKTLGHIPVVSVTNKAIEEVAGEVLTILGK
jgi:[pyruvate, water dikinase]-phosphate phosphotransferase / [pyruvate, water dikinase] kinase